jgi:hypothetical protein
MIMGVFIFSSEEGLIPNQGNVTRVKFKGRSSSRLRRGLWSKGMDKDNLSWVVGTKVEVRKIKDTRIN